MRKVGDFSSYAGDQSIEIAVGRAKERGAIGGKRCVCVVISYGS